MRTDDVAAARSREQRMARLARDPAAAVEGFTDLDAQHLADQAEITRLRTVVERLWCLARSGTGLGDTQIALRVGLPSPDPLGLVPER
jgi:hypothetical protein